MFRSFFIYLPINKFYRQSKSLNKNKNHDLELRTMIKDANVTTK